MEETAQENGTFDVEITLFQKNSDSFFSIIDVGDVITVPDYIYVSVNLLETDTSNTDMYVQVQVICFNLLSA